MTDGRESRAIVVERYRGFEIEIYLEMADKSEDATSASKATHLDAKIKRSIAQAGLERPNKRPGQFDTFDNNDA